MRSIRWKLIPAVFVVVFLPVYLLNRYAIDAFNGFTSKALEEQMISHAFIIGEQYRAMVLGAAGGGAPGGMEEEFSRLLERYGPKTESRIRVLSPEGVVLFDSSSGAGDEGRSLTGRPEIAAALEGRYKARWSLTPDGELVYYYVALAIRHEGRTVGIAYVTRHTGPIIKAIRSMTRHQRVAMGGALAFAVAISAVVSLTMTRRLRRVTRAAVAYARGETPAEPGVGGRDEIGDLDRAVRHMAAEIARRNRYNREFMSAVVHELRTPITAIRGASEILDDGAGERPEARTKFLGNIRFETERLTRLVGELSELTRLDAEAREVRRVRVDYGPCMREIIERLMPTFDHAHAALAVEIADEPLPVRIVPGRIEQVVSNLLENAFRYTPVDGRVTVAVRREGRDEVLTTVCDTGPGIPEASLEKVFERFYTTEPKGRPREYGSGLGLAIARSIVENHRGRIRAANHPGGGAVISFTLPAERG